MKSWLFLLRDLPAKLERGILVLILLLLASPHVDASDADAGSYPLTLSRIFPDSTLLNANYSSMYGATSYLLSDAALTDLDRQLIKQKQELREKLGVTPFVYYWGDYLGNPVGGGEQGSTWAQLLVFGVSLHSDNYGWKGGSLVASFSDSAGNNLGTGIGNILTPAQALSFTTFASNALYYRQLLFDDKWEFRLGRFSGASVFASLPAMGSLPVSGAVNGTPTSLFTNLSGWHSNGKPSWAAYSKVQTTDDTFWKAAILEVNPQANNPAFHGFDMGFGPNCGSLYLTEFDWTPDFGKTGKGQDAVYPGVYMAGAYYQNYAQPKLVGGYEWQSYGFYLQGQQIIWRESQVPSSKNVSLWGGVTYSPQTETAQIPIMGYGGIYERGLVPTRTKDITMLNYYVAGLSSQYLLPSRNPATCETVLEASHIIQVTEHFQFQPDVQWIIQPGGNPSAKSSLVIGFQVAALF